MANKDNPGGANTGSVAGDAAGQFRKPMKSSDNNGVSSAKPRCITGSDDATVNTAHQQAVELFMNYSKQGPDGDLKNVANNLVPTLRAHLVRVQGLTSK